MGTRAKRFNLVTPFKFFYLFLTCGGLVVIYSIEVRSDQPIQPDRHDIQRKPRELTTEPHREQSEPLNPDIFASFLTRLTRGDIES